MAAHPVALAISYHKMFFLLPHATVSTLSSSGAGELAEAPIFSAAALRQLGEN